MRAKGSVTNIKHPFARMDVKPCLGGIDLRMFQQKIAVTFPSLQGGAWEPQLFSASKCIIYIVNSMAVGIN